MDGIDYGIVIGKIGFSLHNNKAGLLALLFIREQNQEQHVLWCFLGVNRIHTINDSSLGINGVGDGNQCGIYFFPQGLSGVAYYPMTVIVNRYHAYTSFANDQGVVTKIEWKYDGNNWRQ